MDRENGHTSAILLALERNIENIIETVANSTPYTDRLIHIFTEKMVDDEMDGKSNMAMWRKEK